MGNLGANIFSSSARKIQTGQYKADYAAELAGQAQSKMVSEAVKTGKISDLFSKAGSFFGKNKILRIGAIAVIAFLVWKFIFSGILKKSAKRRRAAHARKFVGRKKAA